MGQFSFKLPDVGEGTVQAEIAEWRVKVGERIEEDQPLVEVMTDKAAVELTSPVAGIVQSIAGQAGQMAAVGSVLVVLETESPDPGPPAGTAGGNEHAHREQLTSPPSGTGGGHEHREQLASSPSGTGGEHAHREQLTSSPSGTGGEHEHREQLTSPPPVAGGGSGRGRAAVVTAPAEQSTSTSTSPRTDTREKVAPAASVAPRPTLACARSARAAASPAVRRRAEELGVKLQSVRGSGPDGRISHADLDAYLAGESAATAGATPDGEYARRTGVEEIPVIGLRRQIAERMQLAKRQIPHFSYVEEVDVTELEDLRAHLNAARADGQPKLTLLPFIMRALVRVLPEFPQINATYDDEAGIVRRYAPVHIGIATQTPRGLLVAVVSHAEARDAWNCAAEISRLASAARDGKATREDLTGSTITVTSLGRLGGVVTTPVINRPEVAIVGPNRIMERAVVRDGQIVVRRMMNLSSSFDHRVVDGAEAAEFIQRIRAVLEHPATLFIR